MLYKNRSIFIPAKYLPPHSLSTKQRTSPLPLKCQTKRKKPEPQTFLTRTLPSPINIKRLYAKKLRIFNKNALAKGYSPAKAKQRALEAGWTEEEIEEAFNKNRIQVIIVVKTGLIADDIRIKFPS